MRLDDAIKSFEASERRLAALRRAQSVLGFDGMTCAPKNSAGGRAQTLGALSRAAHGELLSNARFEAASAVAEHGEGVDEALLLKARDALREREKLQKKGRGSACGIQRADRRGVCRVAGGEKTQRLFIALPVS